MKIIGVLFLISASVSAAQSGSPQPVGEVSFENSGAAAAQAEFLRGLAQLHNFEYDDAALHFREAQKIDPGFAVAYWGEAMTKNHGVWHEQDQRAALEILSRLGATPAARQAKAPTEREKLYLGAVETLYGDGSKEQRDQKYMGDMARLHQRYPADVDAAAFYALAILSSAEQGRDFAIYMRAAAVLEEVFPLHPRHPGVVHYLIHCYDDPIHAPLGLRPARIYAQIAPDAGHAQHMTSHIFLALGMWDEVVRANETATGVVSHHRELAGKPPGLCGHYNEWLLYGYLQLDRIADARRVLEGCRRQAERQAENLALKSDANGNTAAIDSYSVMRAHFLISSELWDDEVARWSLPAGEFPLARFAFDYTDTLAAYESFPVRPRKANAAACGSGRQARCRLARAKHGRRSRKTRRYRANGRSIARIACVLESGCSSSPGRSANGCSEGKRAAPGIWPSRRLQADRGTSRGDVSANAAAAGGPQGICSGSGARTGPATGHAGPGAGTRVSYPAAPDPLFRGDLAQ